MLGMCIPFYYNGVNLLHLRLELNPSLPNRVTQRAAACTARVYGVSRRHAGGQALKKIADESVSRTCRIDRFDLRRWDVEFLSRGMVLSTSSP